MWPFGDGVLTIGEPPSQGDDHPVLYTHLSRKLAGGLRLPCELY